MFRMNRGDREGAREDLRRAVELDPAWGPPQDALRDLAAGKGSDRFEE